MDDTLTQSAKESLAVAILKEFGCFDEAIRLAKAEQLDPKGLPHVSIDYLTHRMQTAMKTIDEAD